VPTTTTTTTTTFKNNSLPIETVKWSGGFAMIPSKGHQADEKAGLSAMEHLQQSCTEVDVMVLNDQHCIAVTHVSGAQAGGASLVSVVSD